MIMRHIVKISSLVFAVGTRSINKDAQRNIY